jgi:malonyl-CoA/methylmalonyl-CoA synthetase
MLSSNRNLFEILRQGFPLDRSKIFLTDSKGKHLSYGEMEASSSQLANYLLSLGLVKGDRVAVQVDKSPHALMTYLACIRAGMIYLPLNTAYTKSELDYFFGDVSPALIIGDETDEVLFKTLALTHHAQFKTLSADGCGSLLSDSACESTNFTSVISNGDDIAAILYTSGTTGRPKGAMLSHDNLSSNALVLVDYWGFSKDDVLLHALPIFHVHGLFVACHCVLAAGASMIFLPTFNTEGVIAHLPLSTVMMGVPTFYTRLLADTDFSAQQCEKIRLFISGSAPLLAKTHHEFEQRSGEVILERYGMSETGMLISNPLQGKRRAGTVGFPLPGVNVRIVNAQQQLISADEIGFIEVKGANVFQGYWNMPEKTAEDFTDDGFFRTGDQGQASEDGFISIVGRAKDMIISGGYNVYPKEVELVIDKLDGVKESAVFGLADIDLGEIVVAVIVAEKGFEIKATDLIFSAKKKLASYKTPKTIFFIEQLPRNTMGKVQKNQLRDQYQC